MKTCTCCGILNEEGLDSCKRCGTNLPSLVNSLPPVIFFERPVLSASGVTLVLFLWFGVQIATAIPLTLFASRTGQPPNLKTIGTIMILSGVASSLVVLLLPLKIPGPYLRDVSPTGAAWVRGPLKGIAQGFSMGILISVAYVALASMLTSAEPDRTMGPLANMAITPGLPQIEWLFGALLLAPTIEELLFRGVLFAGYNRSFGRVRATLLTTCIFCLLHLSEAIHFLPSLLGIASLALAALYVRLRFSAIGPAIALHFGYNATVAVIAIFFSE